MGLVLVLFFSLNYQDSKFHFHFILGRLQAQIPKQMRTFVDSQKSKKTVASMIERKGDEKEVTKKSVKIVEAQKFEPEPIIADNDLLAEDLIVANRKKLAEKLIKKKGDSK